MKNEKSIKKSRFFCSEYMGIGIQNDCSSSSHKHPIIKGLHFWNREGGLALKCIPQKQDPSLDCKQISSLLMSNYIANWLDKIAPEMQVRLIHFSRLWALSFEQKRGYEESWAPRQSEQYQNSSPRSSQKQSKKGCMESRAPTQSE